MLAKGGPRGWVAEARPGWRLAEGLRWPLPAPGGTAWGRRALPTPAAASQRHRLHSSLPLLLLKGHFLSPFWLTFTVLRDTALGCFQSRKGQPQDFKTITIPAVLRS